MNETSVTIGQRVTLASTPGSVGTVRAIRTDLPAWDDLTIGIVWDDDPTGELEFVSAGELVAR